MSAKRNSCNRSYAPLVLSLRRQPGSDRHFLWSSRTLVIAILRILFPRDSRTGQAVSPNSNVHLTTFKNRALIATITVLTAIRTAPAAGVSRTPNCWRAPAASGMETALYPVAHARFWIIFR